MNIKRINFKDVLKIPNKIVIDVRTKKEYLEDHIPTAFNVPLLSEEERKKIGIIYKTQGSEIARRKGVDIVTPKLKNLIDKMLEITDKYLNVIFYCSRGGLRSHSMACFFSLVSDKNIFVIERGYKGYRRYILDFFENIEKEIKGKFLVLDGLTGSGKTLIIEKLKYKNYPVIDLEKLSTHRGSAFGKIGIKEETNQKRFETQLWNELFKLKEKKYIIIEGESKKIGKINLPEGFYRLMQNSPHIWVETDLNFRIENLLNEYLKSNPSNTQIKENLEKIKEFIGKKMLNKMLEDLNNKNYREFIKSLLLNYYDKIYNKKRLKDEQFYRKIYFKNIDEGIEKIEKLYNELTGKKK